MYKLVTTLRKSPALSGEEFWDYWVKEYAPKVLDLPGVAGYRINAAIERSGRPPAFDGVEEVWLATPEAVTAFQKAAAAPELRASAAGFLDPSQMRSALTRERVVLPEPEPGEAELKLCEVAYRRPDLSFAQFDRHWSELHPVPVKKLPGLIGYIQHPVEQTGPTPPYDGHVMVWFDTFENARQSLRTPAGAAVLADEKLFVDGSRLERVAVRELRLR